jgi:hypothetical protein
VAPSEPLVTVVETPEFIRRIDTALILYLGGESDGW